MAKSVYSFDTSRVTEEEDTKDGINESEGSNTDETSHANKKVTIEGMIMLAEKEGWRLTAKALTKQVIRGNTQRHQAAEAPADE